MLCVEFGGLILRRNCEERGGKLPGNLPESDVGQPSQKEETMIIPFCNVYAKKLFNNILDSTEYLVGIW